MVLPLAALGRSKRHIAELRERPQKLPERHRRAVPSSPACAIPKNGLGTGLSQRRGVPSAARGREQLPRHPGSIWLMLRPTLLVPAKTEIAPGRAHVADRERHVAGQLALQVERVLMDDRRAFVLVDEVDAPPTPVSRPSELPIGCCSPPGNGLSSVVMGRSLSAADWLSDVVRAKPIWPWLVACTATARRTCRSRREAPCRG